MRFSEYMSEWLYAEDGYYSNYSPIGKDGDFYTAVSASKFFGGSIAKHIISTIDEGFLEPDCEVCEIGAHKGYLLADIVEFINTLRPELLDSLTFSIVEKHSKLQEIQSRYFKDSFADRVVLKQYSSLGEMESDGTFFIANEIFDAFACELIYRGKCARVDNHKVIFDVDDKDLLDTAKAQNRDRGEIAVGYDQFANDLSKSSKKFEFMSFDYGEMVARSDFSIRLYQNHQVYPFFDESIELESLYQKSDITYDVVFSQVKDAFEEAGVEMVGFKTQLKALVDMGILELLEMLKEHTDERIYKQELEKIKRLILPEFQGERFKMIRFRKERE